MLIEFVPNPSFQPQTPPIRVGSVVMCGKKKGVVSCVENSCIPYRIRLSIDKEVCALRDGVVWLPEKVSGITEQGKWEYAPIDPPPQEFSWEQYPPRAGMVVEEKCYGRLKCVIFGLGDIGWTPVIYNGTRNDSVNDEKLMADYRPRPDLMPRFVQQQEPPNAQ